MPSSTVGLCGRPVSRCVLVFNDNRLGSSSRQDGNNIGQDRKFNQQAVEIHDRMVYQVGEVRIKSCGGLVNMYDILLIQRNKPGNYN